MKERELSIFAVMRRGRWIGMLILALAVAAAFALLGRWQLERAVTSEGGDQRTETVQPLTSIATPQSPVLAMQEGHLVEADGRYAPRGFAILADRYADGVPGYWLIGRFEVGGAAPASLAVGLGWTATLAEAESALRSVPEALRDVSTVRGRYAGTEAPVAPSSGRAGEALPTTLSLASLVNTWTDFATDADVYGGYVIAESAPRGLQTITAGPPEQFVQLNWLNIFYAVEWALFAGFAVFLWYRLVKDAWERELDASLESEYGSGTPTD